MSIHTNLWVESATIPELVAEIQAVANNAKWEARQERQHIKLGQEWECKAHRDHLAQCKERLKALKRLDL